MGRLQWIIQLLMWLGPVSAQVWPQIEAIIAAIITNPPPGFSEGQRAGPAAAAREIDEFVTLAESNGIDGGAARAAAERLMAA